MKSKLVLFSLLLLKNILIGLSQGPTVSLVSNPIIQIEYKCITNEQYYSIEKPVFKIMDLVYNQVYSFNLDTTAIFDALTYDQFPYTFESYGSHWKWIQSGISFDTILLSFDGEYQKLELGSSESIYFGIYTIPPPSYGDLKSVNVSIVPPNPDLEIDGPSIICNNPASFYLLHLPTSYTTASWEIKQGNSVINYGNGTTATATNLQSGAGEVIFTIHFSCGLKDIEYKKDIWFGYPPAPTISPANIVYKSINSLFNVSIIDSPQANPSTGTWETYGCVYPNGIPSGSSAEFLTCENDGCGTIYVSTSNVCGSYYKTSLTVITGNGGDCGDLPERSEAPSLKLNPNPANEFVELSIDEKDLKIRSKQFIIEFFNAHFRLVKSLIIHNSTEKINISDLPRGNYVIRVKGNNYQTSRKLIIQK